MTVVFCRSAYSWRSRRKGRLAHDGQLEDVVLRVGDQEETGYYHASMNCLWFSFTDAYGLPVPLAEEEQILHAELLFGPERRAYPLTMEMVEPVSALEALGIVVRQEGVAVVFVPEEDGMLVQAIQEASWGDDMEATLQEIDKIRALEEQGGELYTLSPKPAFTAHFPLTDKQREEIASYAVDYVDLELTQTPGQILSIPLDAIKDRKRLNQHPLSYELYGQFPIQLYDAYIPQGDVMGAGKWALSFRYENKHSLELHNWYIEGVSDYISGSGGTVSHFGAFVDPAEIKNDVISLEISELHFRQYGDWQYQVKQ